MPGIFINYRREDTGGSAGRLFDILTAHFAPNTIFMDIDSIRGGEDFAEVIETRIAACDILLALIGDRWLTVSEPNGTPRLHSPDDFVRIEISKAFERNVRVIPILLGRATMPPAADLPPSLHALSGRHAMDLRDAHFHEDADRLIQILTEVAPHLAPHVIERKRRLPATPLSLALAAFAIAAAVLIGWLLHRKPAAPTASQPTPQTAAPIASQTAAQTAAQTATQSPSKPSPKSAQTEAPKPSQRAVPKPTQRELPKASQSDAQSTSPPPATIARRELPEFPQNPTKPGLNLAGKWRATVTYDWPNAVYNEHFNFELDGTNLSGTASFLDADRGILEGHLLGDRVTFSTSSTEELDNKLYENKHRYHGTLAGDTLHLTMQTEGSPESHIPIHFTAARSASR